MRQSNVFLVVGALLIGGCGSELVGIESASADDSADGIVGGSLYSGLPAIGAITVDGDQYCTGTIIGPRLVVTAAHCLEDPNASQMRFVIGASITSPDYTLGVASFKAHPSYNSSTITNDIGYVTLSSDAPVDALGVNNSMDSSWVGKDLLFVGYGVTSGTTNAGAGKKRAVTMGIASVASKTFEYDDAGKNTCYGDSGGPALIKAANGNYLVAGVTSYGDEGCTQYGVDTRVDAFLSFLGVTGSSINDSSTDTDTDDSDSTDTSTSVTVEGVIFTAAEITEVLDLVNTATVDVLDDDVGLDSRAAANLVAKRPFDTIEEVAAVSYVGTTALKKLKAYVDAN